MGAACYDFMRTGFDTLVTTPLDMSLNTTPCVSCGRCAETCPTGALMPKPRVLEQYDVDESRCILCGICVDACPYDALRCGPDFELAHESRSGAADRPHRAGFASSAIPSSATYAASATGWLAPRPMAVTSRTERLLPMLPPGLAGNGQTSNGAGNGATGGSGGGSAQIHHK